MLRAPSVVAGAGGLANTDERERHGGGAPRPRLLSDTNTEERHGGAHTPRPRLLSEGCPAIADVGGNLGQWQYYTRS